MVWNFKVIPSASLNLLNLNYEHPLKNWFLWSNPYKIEVNITFLIEMLELLNFDHDHIYNIICLTIKFCWCPLSLSSFWGR